MATETDIARLRRDVGVTEDELSDAQAEAIFQEAEELYSGTQSQLAATRVIALQGMLATAAHDVTYTQNNASETLSDRFRHLQTLLAMWRDQLDAAILAEQDDTAGWQAAPTHSVRVRPVW